jgi:hypothetical protein
VARLPRFRRADGKAQPAPPRPPRRSLPHPGVLRRERRALLRAREDRLRDLGGLMLEMYRRDQFRQDLLIERCDELIALDDRVQELDSLLAAAVSSRRAAPAARCACGAPIVAGAHFCANCGRAVAAAPAAVTCVNCGSPLPAEATYCAACGAKVEPVGKASEEPAAAAVAERWES